MSEVILYSSAHAGCLQHSLLPSLNLLPRHLCEDPRGTPAAGSLTISRHLTESLTTCVENHDPCFHTLHQQPSERRYGGPRAVSYERDTPYRAWAFPLAATVAKRADRRLLPSQPRLTYSSASLIRSSLLLGPYSSPMPRSLRWS
jgi:hypothetical protein